MKVGSCATCRTCPAGPSHSCSPPMTRSCAPPSSGSSARPWTGRRRTAAAVEGRPTTPVWHRGRTAYSWVYARSRPPGAELHGSAGPWPWRTACTERESNLPRPDLPRCTTRPWTSPDSNRTPPRCKRGALPDELQAQVEHRQTRFARRWPRRSVPVWCVLDVRAAARPSSYEVSGSRLGSNTGDTPPVRGTPPRRTRRRTRTGTVRALNAVPLPLGYPGMGWVRADLRGRTRVQDRLWQASRAGVRARTGTSRLRGECATRCAAPA
jgi:hypothetical protein